MAKNVIEKDTQAFLNMLAKGGGPPIYTLSPKDARGILSRAQGGDVKKLSADIEDRNIPFKHEISIRIVRPSGNKNKLPVVMYFHGGGWVLGGKDTHDRLIRDLANGANCAIVFVNYSSSPEAQYPVPIEEASSEINVDASKLAVAGDSVGGNMAIAVTIMCKERKGPKLVFQCLFYPVTDATFDNESYKLFQNGPWLTLPAMRWFWDQYAPDHSVWGEPTASPLRAPTDLFTDMPPALVITDEFDVLRDEGECFAKKLIEAGVTVTVTRYLGTIHDFVMLNALSHTPAVRAAIAQACECLKNAFK
jgi:acetyl esterase